MKYSTGTDIVSEDIEMKIFSLIMGVLLLSILFSPALATSKSDLISFYRTKTDVSPAFLPSTINLSTNGSPSAGEDSFSLVNKIWIFNAYRYRHYSTEGCERIHYLLPDGTMI
ncbi:MAG: hypothetical protein LLF84_09030 [Methanoregulaceae archaeon]|nr:hypothetical protein [Methanoregulaceae archaeon]